MTFRRKLVVAAGVLVLITVGLALGLSGYLRLQPLAAASRPVIFSGWSDGRRVLRVVGPGEGARPAPSPGISFVEEQVVAEAPLLSFSQALLGVSLRPGRDGVHARLGGRSAYLMPDDLVAAQAYWVPCRTGSFNYRCSVDVKKMLTGLARELSATPDEVWHSARLSRFIVEPYPAKPAPSSVTVERLTQGVLGAAQYLARNLSSRGVFRYEVNALTNVSRNLDYSLARHAGAAWFLVNAGVRLKDAEVLAAGRRAARWLASDATQSCGSYRCIGSLRGKASLGSSALALLAYIELAQFGEAQEREFFKVRALELSQFIRSLQRADGEFKHEYDRVNNQPVDVQYRYFTGEAAFALARAQRYTHDVRELEAASHALAYITAHWSFFGSQYYFDAEHWTCEAVAELWSQAPDRAALDFCLRWSSFNRALQDGDGGYTAIDPFARARVTQAATHAEGGISTLVAATRAEIAPTTLSLLNLQMGRALDYLLTQQLLPGRAHLFKDAQAVRGGLPGSAVDYELRIDYPQHAGGAMLRYLAYLEQQNKK